jgi:NAD(P)H-hydrate epimerase
MKNIINNRRVLWRDGFPRKKGDIHKYDFGLALIYGAPKLTGASRLAAECCARAGCGLVSVLVGETEAPIYKSSLPAHIMVQNDISYFHDKCSARLVGCGGLPDDFTLDDLAPHNVPTIFDADALHANFLKFPLPYPAILTPHEGEFARLFPDIKGSREERIVEAVKKSGCTIVLKGAHTLICGPDNPEHIVCNKHASPILATAGSGDALAGIIAGLVAQKMNIFDAACAACWIHGETSLLCGLGFVASDIPIYMPAALQKLR